MYDFLVNNYKNFCKTFNIPSTPSILGSGQFGTAYDIGGNRVLKITKDETEANTSSYLVKRKLKYTWNVDYVGYVDKDVNFYVIIGEKLSKLSKDEEMMLEILIDALFDQGTYSPSVTVFANINQLKDYIYGSIESGFEYDKKLHLKFTGYNIESPKINWLFAALKELMNSGIVWADLHHENVMKNSNIYKFIDLGFESKAPEMDIKRIEGRKL